MLNDFKRNELFQDYKDMENIVQIQLFQENKIILLTHSNILIYNVIEKQLLLTKECTSDKIWIYDNIKFFIELKEEFLLYEFIENKNEYSLKRLGSINKNFIQHRYYNSILIQGKIRKKIIIFSIKLLNIQNFKKNRFELQTKIKINSEIECNIKPFVLDNTLGYFLINKKKVKITFCIFNRKYELKKKDLDEIDIGKEIIKYSDINYKELKKVQDNQNKFILAFNYYYLRFYLYQIKDLKLINKTIIKSGPFYHFYISNNGNIYAIGKNDNCIYENNIEKSEDNKIPYYVGWNFCDKEKDNRLISDFQHNKIDQLIVFENKKKLFIFKRRDGFSDIYYVSFYFYKRSLTYLIKYPGIIIARFLAVFFTWGFVFNKWRISIRDFFCIICATYYLFFKEFYMVIGIVLSIIISKGFYILFKSFLTYLLK